MQVDPIKATLKAPGSKLLKLEHEKLLSNFVFNFNLRHSTEEWSRLVRACAVGAPASWGGVGGASHRGGGGGGGAGEGPVRLAAPLPQPPPPPSGGGGGGGGNGGGDGGGGGGGSGKYKVGRCRWTDQFRMESA